MNAEGYVLIHSVTTETLKSVTLASKGLALGVKLIHQQLRIHDEVHSFKSKQKKTKRKRFKVQCGFAGKKCHTTLE